MSRYIGDISLIYCVSGGVDMIFRGEKSKERYLRKYRQNIDDISARRDISEIFFEKIASGGKISAIYRR